MIADHDDDAARRTRLIFLSWAHDLAQRQYFVGLRRGEKTVLILRDGEVELK